MQNYTWYLENVTNERWAYMPVFTPEECSKIIEQCSALPVEDGLLEKTVQQDSLNRKIRNCERSWVPVNKETEWIFRKCSDAVMTINLNFFKYDLDYIEDLQFTIYESSKNHFADKHIDTLYSSYSTRKLSFTIVLTEESTFEGGDLLLHNSYTPDIASRHHGLMTAFPSFVLHEVTPVTSGKRISLVGWVNGKPFK